MGSLALDPAAIEFDDGFARIVTMSDCYSAIPEDGMHLCPDREYHDVDICKHLYALEIVRDQIDAPAGWLVVEDLNERGCDVRVDAVEEWGVYGGVDEPRWDPVGWHFHAGSLSVTGTILDAKWEAMDLLDRHHAADGRWERLGAYLEQCHHGPGRFAHNTIPPDSQAWDVQNTTAFALYLMSHDTHDASADDHAVYARVDDAVSHLLDGQRPDGFWPYIYPSRLQRALYHLEPLRPVFEERMVGGDSSIFFGDVSHQCYTAYLLLKSVTDGDRDGCLRAVRRAWTWIRQRLLETDEGVLRIAYECEPEIDRVRYTNVGDTMAYFLVLSMLPKLVDVGVVDRAVADETAAGLVSHLVDSLLEPDGTPCLPAHEKSRSERRHLLPAVDGPAPAPGEGFPEPVDDRSLRTLDIDLEHVGGRQLPLRQECVPTDDLDLDCRLSLPLPQGVGSRSLAPGRGPDRRRPVGVRERVRADGVVPAVPRQVRP